jgi:hypothetical protein
MSFRATSAARTLVRAALALSAAGAAMGAAAGAAQAGGLPAGLDSVAGGGLTGATNAVAPVEHLRLDPTAHTTVDPLTNSVGTQVGDFRPIGTAAVTKPLADGDSLSQLLGGVLHG